MNILEVFHVMMTISFNFHLHLLQFSFKVLVELPHERQDQPYYPNQDAKA
jgi:hypothetical protein